MHFFIIKLSCGGGLRSRTRSNTCGQTPDNVVEACNTHPGKNIFKTYRKIEFNTEISLKSRGLNVVYRFSRNLFSENRTDMSIQKPLIVDQSIKLSVVFNISKIEQYGKTKSI